MTIDYYPMRFRVFYFDEEVNASVAVDFTGLFCTFMGLTITLSLVKRIKDGIKSRPS